MWLCLSYAYRMLVYFLNFLLNNDKPRRPPPRRSIVAGSGIESAGGAKTVTLTVQESSPEVTVSFVVKEAVFS